MTKNNTIGKIFVIEGADGTGKQTQTERVIERAKEEGYFVQTISFPQYDKFFGKEIKNYLSGKFGNLKEVHPKLASVLYFLDQHSAYYDLWNWLHQGFNIILDRYMESNMAHQSGKYKGKKREKMLEWLDECAIRQLGLPKSDLVIYLDLPVKYSIKAMEKEGRKKDLHESDINYLKATRSTYRMLAKRNDHWTLLNCLKKKERKTIDEIAEEIWSVVKPHLVK